MSASAGRVLLKPKGPYNALTAYTPLDYVTYTDGNTYVCHTPTTGHAPTDTNYWQILVDNSGVVHTVDIANDLTTQTAGKVLDARQGYALNTSLTKQANQISKNTDVYSSLKTYAVGDHCISPDDGTYQKCITAITTPGSSWATVKSSCFEEDTLVNGVNALNIITEEAVAAETGITYNERYVYKSNHTVNLYIVIDTNDNTAQCPAWGSLIIGNVPSGFRPKKPIRRNMLIADKTTQKWIDVNLTIFSNNGNVVLSDNMVGTGFIPRTVFITETWIS